MTMRRLTFLALIALFASHGTMALVAEGDNSAKSDEVVTQGLGGESIEENKNEVKPEIPAQQDVVVASDGEEEAVKNDDEDADEEDDFAVDPEEEEFAAEMLNTLLASAGDEEADENFEKELEDSVEKGMKNLEELLA